MQSPFPSFGEVFITNSDVQGSVENLTLFKGKQISSICGGCRKLFIIEDGHGNEGIISTLHGPESDQYDQTFTEEFKNENFDEQVFQAFDNKGQIKKIVTGKKHTVFQTEDGKLYSYGYGEYGALGHGGMIETKVPKLINKLNNRIISQLACGEYHTMALTIQQDLYAWGRGFEGQLGIRKDVDTASVPSFVTFFYKNPAVQIACGSYHSLAIDKEGKLYGWGEARFGQLGCGKKVKETTPVLIDLLNNQNNDVQLNQTQQSQFKINPLNNLQSDKNPNDINRKITCISAGYSHTAVITNTGELYTFGFNQRGQLGHGDKKSRYFPKKVVQDLLGNQVPLFNKVSCGYFTTFAIDVNGSLWSWGGGNLGHKNETLVDLPRRVSENVENRRFTYIMANGSAAVFFAALRTTSIRPNYGPSCGGTLITLIGSGFCDTGRQSVRFTFGQKCVQEVACSYDEMTDSFGCTTPRFEEAAEEEGIHWPADCKVEVTLDGIVYIPCESNFLIYSSKLQITTVFPKCASVEGGTTLLLSINIDEKTSSYMKHLTIGFQPRTKKEKDAPKKKDQMQLLAPTVQKNSKEPSSSDLLGQKKTSQHSNNPAGGAADEKDKQFKNQLNPLDLSTNDPELEKENWICVEGFYEKGKISCVVPKVTDLKTDALNFSVDVSINGQQFTGNPVVFRFYDIKINLIKPDNVMSEGGTPVKIIGEGFFDTSNKKVIFKTKFGERLIEITWDKQERCYTLVAPPITWLLGGQKPTPELLNEVKESGVETLLTLSGVEWIQVGKFYYIDPEVVRIAPVVFEVGLSEEEKQHRWHSPMEDEDPYAKCANEQEKLKKQDEIKKQLEAEDNEIATLFKRAGAYLYLFGQNFIPTENLICQFIYNGNKAVLAKGVFKNKAKIGVQIPEIEELTLGIHEITIEISLNNQQYSHSNKKFRYIAFDKVMTPEQKQKYEDEEIKKLKKPPGKK